MKRKIATALSVLALGAALMGVVPANAAAGAACQLIGTAHLEDETPLADASHGSGNFSIGTLTCVGSVVGSGAVTGPFRFCRHNDPRASFQDNNNDGWDDRAARSACHDTRHNGPNEALDPAYDAIVGTTGQGVIAHFKGGPVTATGFDIGGTCTFNFEGHAAVSQAEIAITDFKCSGIPKMNGVATATPGFIVTPCSQGGCFQDLTFLGTIQVTD